MTRALQEYRDKRDFTRTNEPSGDADGRAGTGQRHFVVQKHAARRLHWDFRLEWNGVLLSWAVTRGPSASPAAKRLAVRTEDHPLSYSDFEGTIPKPQYGAGTVMLWDQGTWTPLGDVDKGLSEGMLKFELSGSRMQGAWMLVRMKPRGGEKRENWLLIKEKDAHATQEAEGLVSTHTTSITTGRDMDEITAGAAEKPKPKAKAKAKAKNKAKNKGAVLDRPAFRPVQLAKLHTTVPAGDDWLHEVKVDGYRCLAAVGAGSVRLYTRSGLDWTQTFGALRPAFESLPCKNALIDGEMVAAGVEKNAFSELQSRLKHGGALDFVAFDLLHLDGQDLTGQPLIARKAALEDLLADCGDRIKFSSHIEGHGAEAWSQVCAAGREGLISKLAKAPYRGGRHASWLKLKCGQRQEFVIGGYSPSTSRGRPFASLLMGTYEAGSLVYRGRVGTGFDARAFETLLPLLQQRSRKTSPFAEVPADVRGAHWVRPDLVAEIKFAEITAAGHIRHGVFQALRRDKPAKDVSLDAVEPVSPPEQNDSPPVKSEKGKRGVRIGNVTITNPERKVFDTPVVSKRQVAQHYADVAPRMMPFVRKRPVSLLRCPDGIAGQCFFQKHRGSGMPAAIGTVAVSKSEEDTDYIALSSPTGLVAAAQMGALEFHIWGSSNAALDKPDRIVFDLDPDEALSFADVRAAAFEMRGRLDDLGMRSVAMLTGGKGIHVIVPLRPKATWDTVKLFSRTLAVMLAEQAPDRYIATMSKAKRKGLIFIDWLRNERGATAVAPYSVRARPGAKVAVPLLWDELASVQSAGAFDIASMSGRLEQPCPLLEATRQAGSLDRDVIRKLEEQLDH